MANASQCPKCGGAMIRGFIVDKTHGGTAVPAWVEGEPRKSLWTGLKLRGRTRIEIATSRCRSCFFLESYAPAG